MIFILKAYDADDDNVTIVDCFVVIRIILQLFVVKKKMNF